MTVQELIARFPDIPKGLHQEPLLAQLAEVCGDLFRMAQKPSACSTQHDPRNHYYLKLIGPMSIHGYGLSTREEVLAELQALLDQYTANPTGFAANLLSADTADKEVKGPGCR